MLLLFCTKSRLQSDQFRPIVACTDPEDHVKTWMKKRMVRTLRHHTGLQQLPLVLFFLWADEQKSISATAATVTTHPLLLNIIKQAHSIDTNTL